MPAGVPSCVATWGDDGGTKTPGCVVAPVVLFVALSLLEPGYMEPLTHTAGGIAVSILCAFMVFLGWLSMRRIVKIEA